MKRFFTIFGICIASLVVFLGAYLGICFLKGDFNEEKILPNDIRFEQENYYVSDSFEMTILTDTLDVNQKSVSLSFNTLPQPTSDKSKITDGVLIIPKTVKIGEPFTVELKKDYDEELGKNWINGGVSTIIAKSQNQLINSSIATVYVDVPVDKTELVIFNKTAQLNEGDSFESSLGYIEKYSKLNSTLITASEAELLEKEIENIQRGDTIYVGIKYYPTRSAVKYSKINSTNLMVEFISEIEDRLLQLNIENEEIQKLKEMFVFDATVNKYITIKEFVEQYNKVIASLKNSSYADEFEQIQEKFKQSLKYNTLDEKINNEISKILNIEKVEGTNFYQLTASDSDGSVDLYSYTFKNALIEDENNIVLQTNDKTQILPLLEQFSQVNVNKSVKREGTLNIEDVGVDSIIVNGSIEDVYTNQKITLVVGKNGINDKLTSYLQVVLKNSLSPNVDLQSKLSNIAIRFEEKLPGNLGKSLDGIINFIGSETIIDSQGLIFYKPIIDNNNPNSSYWEFYSETAVVNDIRIRVKYFLDDGTEIETIPNEGFTLTEVSKVTENSVTWLNTEDIDLKTIQLEGIIDVESGEASNIVDFSQNVSYNFNNNVSINDNNFYQTYKIFVYSESAEEKIVEDFYNIKEAKTYTLGINTLNLYELESGILQIKDSENIPTYEVFVVFATIKTDYKGTPILTSEGLYNVIKYSEDKDGNLSSIKVTCSNSIKTIAGKLKIEDSNKAGVIEEGNEEIKEKVLKIAHASNNVLKVELSSTDAGFKTAVHNGEVNVVAKNALNSVVNYVTASLEEITDVSAVAVISTKEVLLDTNISFYITYTIFNQSFLYPIVYDESIMVDSSEGAIITNKIDSTAEFDFKIDLSEVQQINVDTIFDNVNGLQKSYTYNKLDGTQENLTKENIFTNNIVNVKITNFLGNDGNDNWYLTSNNSKVVQVTNNGLSFSVGTAGVAELSLFIEGIEKCQAKVIINVGDSGYVSRYKVYDVNGVSEQIFNESNVYNPNKTISVKLNGASLQKINLGIEEGNIFELYYVIGENEYKISFKIYVEEESSKSILKELTGVTLIKDPESADLEENMLSDSNKFLTINKDLGATERITFVYKNDKLGIYQDVTLDITQIVNVKSVDVLYEDDKEIEFNNNSYKIYSQSNFNINVELNKTGEDLYYFTYGIKDGSEVATYNPINATSKDIKKQNNLFIFDEVGVETEISVYVSNKAEPKYGDLKYQLLFKVQPNIKVESTKARVELINGTGTLDITELFVRIKGNALFDGITYETEANVHYVAGILTFTDNKVVNEKTLSMIFSLKGTRIAVTTIALYPKSLEIESASRIALYNTEKTIVLVAGDDVAASIDNYIISSVNEQFEAGASIRITGNFSEYFNANGKIINSTINLLQDTNCYAEIKDSVGNIARYKLIISALQYPFINFDKTNEELKKLDLYNLYENTANLKEYYSNNDLFITIKGGVSDLNDSALTLYPTGGESESYLYNAQLNSIISFTGASIDETEGLKYIDINGYELNPKIVGLSEVYVKVIMTCKVGTKTYQIPTIVKITQSQILKLKYPYETEECELENFNEEEMLASATEFGNLPMEYISSNVSGIANLTLSNERFVVYKFDKEANNWIVDDYNQGFSISLSAVAVNIDDEWSFINKDSFKSYITITGNILSVYKYNASAIRVKLKIETNNGNAFNYYVVSVDEKISLTLYKSVGDSHSIVNGEDSLEVQADDIIMLRSQSGTYVSYYLNNYNDKLYYSVTDENGEELTNVFSESVDSTSIKLITNKFPNGKKVYLHLFTKYGELTVVTVNILPYYRHEIEVNEVYGGTTIGISSLINVIQISNNLDITEYEVKEWEVLDNNEIYDGVTIESNNLTFKHVVTDKVVQLNLTLSINNEDEYLLILPLTIKNNVFVIEQPLLPDVLYQVDGYLDNITNDTWEGLFGTNDGTIYDLVDCEFIVIYNNNKLEKSDGKYIFENILTSEITTNIYYQIVSGELVLAQIKVGTRIMPQYTIQIHYPKPNSETNFQCEYVEIGKNINLLSSGFDGIQRVIVERILKTNSGDYIYEEVDRNAFDNEMNVSYDEKTEPEKPNEILIAVKNDILGRTINLGVYKIVVLETSPYSFINELPQRGADEAYYIYAGYGDTDIFDYYDLVITLPSIDTLNEGKSDTETKFDIEKPFNIVAKKSETTTVDVRTNLYYDSNAGTIKLRGVVKYSDVENINNLTLYIQQGTGSSAFSFTINKGDKYVTVSERARIQYNGKQVDSQYYAILKTEVADSISVEKEKVKIYADINLETYGADISKTDGAESKEVIDNIVVELNANEIKEGVSLISTYGIKDELGIKFWYNNVSKNENNSKTLSLTIVGNYSVNNKNELNRIYYSDALVIEPKYNKDNIIYDYSLKAVGAINAGTIVKLQLTYVGNTEGTSESTVKENTNHYLYVKVNSDIVFELRNNNNTATPNSVDNRLEIQRTVEGISLTLANVNTNNADKNNYYVYAYGKYDAGSYNVAQNMSYSVAGSTYGSITYVSLSKSNNGSLMLNYENAPGFADRKVEIYFIDAYGFRFEYYIKLIATYSIESEINTAQTVYEGDLIEIYNANTTESKAGIGVKIIDSAKKELYGGAVDIVEIIQLEIETSTNSIVFVGDEVKQFITREGNGITFNYLIINTINPWDTYGDGDSISLSISVAVKATDTEAEETYHVIGYFTLNKKYEFSIKTENTFVRDSVEFDIAQYVSVYDNSTQTYLGEPTLNDVETIKVSGLQIDLGALTYNGGISFEIVKDGKYFATINSNGANVVDIINGDNVSYTKEDKTTSIDGADKDLIELELKNAVLNAYGIRYESSSEVYKIKLTICAKNKITSSEQFKEQEFEFKKISDRIEISDDNIATIQTNSTEETGNYVVINQQFTSDVSAETHIFDLRMTNVESPVASTNTDLSNGKATNSKLPIKVIKRLYVYVYDNVVDESTKLTVKLNVDGNKKDRTLSKGENNILLYEYENNKIIELFTGKIENEPYTYLNGFNLTNVKVAKGIENAKITLDASDYETTSLMLGDTDFNYDSTYNVYYQTRAEQSIKISYNGIIEPIKGTFNVTHKFTSVNTQDAYIGTSTIHYIDKDKIVELDGVNGFDYSIWSEMFKLIPGVGKSAVLASGDDLSFITNIKSNPNDSNSKDLLTFKLKEIIGETMGGNNKIVLEDTNRLNVIDSSIIPNITNYYVTIDVYCEAVNIDNRAKQIGTIYLGFYLPIKTEQNELSLIDTTNTYYTLKTKTIILSNANIVGVEEPTLYDYLSLPDNANISFEIINLRIELSDDKTTIRIYKNGFISGISYIFTIGGQSIGGLILNGISIETTTIRVTDSSFATEDIKLIGTSYADSTLKTYLTEKASAVLKVVKNNTMQEVEITIASDKSKITLGSVVVSGDKLDIIINDQYMGTLTISE